MNLARWFDSPRWRVIWTRAIDACREMGVLLMVFGPLEASISRNDIAPLGFFLIAGIVLFCLALIAEVWNLVQ